jgi:hypothetical protein
MSVSPGNGESRLIGATPFPREHEHTDLGAYLRSLEGQVQAMALEIEVLPSREGRWL